MIPPNSNLITFWEWFILVMVLYNLFSAPYIISFVESNTSKCGDRGPIAPILTLLSKACQAQESYDDAIAQHPADLEAALEGTPVQYAVYLPCASVIFSICNHVSDSAFFVDIVLNFLTGYIPPRSSVPEQRLKYIAINYIRDTFFLDAVATFPWETVLRWWFPSMKDWLGLKMINLVRFIRLIKVQRKLGDYLTPMVHFGSLIGIYLMCAHCLGCFMFFIARYQLWGVDGVASVNDFLDHMASFNTSAQFGCSGDPWIVKECINYADSSTQYSVSLYWSVTTITTVGYGDIVPNTNTDKIAVMLAMFCSGVLQAAILANVALIIDAIQSKRANVNERVKQVTAALNFHDIPAPLVQRVIDSIEYYASQHYGTEDQEIMKLFPDRLRADIATAVLGDVYPAIGIFHGCSRSLSRQLAVRWTMMIAPPNEPIIVTGAPVVEMYHLVHGVCAARTSSGIHIDTLQAGSALGHLDAVLGTPCGADILAKTYCTMYCLPVMDMLEVFESFPEEAERIRARAHEERSRSRDATVAKLLHARSAVRLNPSRSGMQASALRALADVNDSASDQPQEADSICDLLPQSQQGSILGIEAALPENSEADMFSRDTVPAQSAQGSMLVRDSTLPQQAALSQARQKVQGMILSLQDTTSTLGAMLHTPD